MDYIEADADARLAKAGYDSNGNPLGSDGNPVASEDLMSLGKRDASKGVMDQAAKDIAAFSKPSRIDAHIDAKTESLRRFTDRHAYFKAVLLPPETDEARKARAAWGQKLLDGTLSEDSRALIAFHVDGELAALGKKFSVRRDELAAVMRCSSGTVHKLISVGRRLWEKVTRDARAESEPKAPLRDTAREAAALTEASKTLIAATLVEIDVRGEISAIDKADRKAGVTMLPHSILRMLDVLGLSDDEATRRELAALKPSAQQQWCADQIRVAIAGTSEQRAAARKRCGIHYHTLVRECVSLHAKSVKSKRLAGKAA